MKLSSPAFKHNEMIPKKYTCQGEDVNPPLVIEGVPEGTKTLALIMDDPDAPGATWDHWLLFDVPVVGRIEENSVPGKQGRNTWGRSDHGGPCPPSGTHRYFFKLYALDAELGLKEGVDKRTIEKAMQGHVKASCELIGLYKQS